ncbi:uncharacterized protein LOC113496424 [Trichoplusia ni]|uniref:Uncharacterized protein LOC113496424 n=1 Tax=Trichoplusia ni TaxID=7111 RepID=A0A7E5VTF1_TRINI|nr:uncharacterized protein LOC113496424 [Trichoplusia ni]
MYKLAPLVLALAISAFAAEISSPYSQKNDAVFKPEIIAPPVETHAVVKESKIESEHPVYRGDENHRGRARIAPVRSFGPVIKHEGMLADQPAPTEIKRGEEVGILEQDYIPGASDVLYPDVPYAPAYLYDTGYSASNHYDVSNYMIDPDLSTFGLLWSQVPDARTMAGFVGRTFVWVFNSIFILILGSLLTVGVCTYTNLCSIAFHGVGPIHEEMRAMMTPDRLEKISHAADFVKTAIDKYQKIQKVTDAAGMRRRRAIFNY